MRTASAGKEQKTCSRRTQAYRVAVELTTPLLITHQSRVVRQSLIPAAMSRSKPQLVTQLQHPRHLDARDLRRCAHTQLWRRGLPGRQAKFSSGPCTRPGGGALPAVFLPGQALRGSRRGNTCRETQIPHRVRRGAEVRVGVMNCVGQSSFRARAGTLSECGPRFGRTGPPSIEVDARARGQQSARCWPGLWPTFPSNCGECDLLRPSTG